MRKVSEETIRDAAQALARDAELLEPPGPRFQPIRTDVLETLVTNYVAQTALLRKLCAHLGVDTEGVL